MKLHLLVPLGLLLSTACLIPAPALPEQGSLELVACVATHSGEGSEIISLVQPLRMLALSNSRAGTVELFDLTDPESPKSTRVIQLGLAKDEEATSVALHPTGRYCLVAVRKDAALQRGRVDVFDTKTGLARARVAVGVHPDCVVISPDGSCALLANEGEGYQAQETGGYVSGNGSFTLLRLNAIGLEGEPVQIELPDITGIAGVTRPADGRKLERKIDGEMEMIKLSGGLPFELEPEAIAFAPNSKRCFITLQENNAVAIVDAVAGTLERVVGLGMTSHLGDRTNDGEVSFTEALLALREPDGIAVTPNGAVFVTADEGDTEPKASKTKKGSPTGGGRTVSLFDAKTGAFLGDTGNQLDGAALRAEIYPDGRSENKGSEPEMLTTFQLGARTYCAVGLERASAVALIDISEPRAPWTLGVTSCGPGIQAPEGVCHLKIDEQTAYVLTANEVGGTLSVFRLQL